MGSKILWAIVGGFMLGVAVRSYIFVSWPYAAFIALLGCGAIAYGLFEKEKKRELIVVCILLVSCAGGILRMDAAGRIGEGSLTTFIGSKVTLVGVVVEEPDARENSVHLSVRASEIVVGSATTSIRAGVLVFVPLHTPVEYGDVVEVRGTLGLPEAFDTGSGRTFSYPEYLAKDGILYVLSFASAVPTGERQANPAKSAALWVKHKLLYGLRNAIPEPEAGLAAGITLGDKRAGGSELSEVFIRASLIHIVVLSGYNITVVINAASHILSALPRTLRFGASGIVVVFFILMTGGAATAVRAGIMAFLAVYARLSGRTFIALRALGAAAFLMVLWNPFTLAFDPSFQLSALATLGLVLITPIVAKRMNRISERFGLREIVSSTIATQVAVLPLLLYQNGNLSLVALPANIFALAAVPFAMGFSGLAAIIGIFVGKFAVFVGLPAYILLSYIILIAELFANLPFAAVIVPKFSAWVVLVAYCLLFVGVWRFTQKENDQS